LLFGQQLRWAHLILTRWKLLRLHAKLLLIWFLLALLLALLLLLLTLLLLTLLLLTLLLALLTLLLTLLTLLALLLTLLLTLLTLLFTLLLALRRNGIRSSPWLRTLPRMSSWRWGRKVRNTSILLTREIRLVNTEKLTQLAEFLETEHEEFEFSMSNFYVEVDCKTIGCIAGAACFLDDNQPTRPFDMAEIATANLELDEPQAGALFLPDESTFYEPGDPCRNTWGATVVPDWSDITPKQAAAVVRHLIATGAVDWRVAKDIT
jgi:hypothetical protein